MVIAYSERCYFAGLAMRLESPLYSLAKKKKAVNVEGGKEKKSSGKYASLLIFVGIVDILYCT